MQRMMWSVLATATMTDAAMQRWPAQPDIEATTLLAVISTVGVGHDDQVVLGAAQRQHPLERRGAAPVDDLRHLGGADEADRLDPGMVADRLHRFLPAVHDLEHALGQARLAQQLGDPAGAQRHQLRGLEHQAVAQRDRVGDRPVGHHVGEVERGDRGHHAEGEPLDPALDPAAHLQHLARSDLRQRAGELGQLGRLEHLGAGLARDLAVLLGDQRRQLVDVLLEQRLVAVEDLHPLLDRGAAPAGERLPGALDRRSTSRREESGTREMMAPAPGRRRRGSGGPSRRRRRRSSSGQRGISWGWLACGLSAEHREGSGGAQTLLPGIPSDAVADSVGLRDAAWLGRPGGPIQQDLPPTRVSRPASGERGGRGERRPRPRITERTGPEHDDDGFDFRARPPHRAGAGRPGPPATSAGSRKATSGAPPSSSRGWASSPASGCSTWPAAPATSPSRPPAGAPVTGIDIAPNLIGRPCQRRGLRVAFDVGDAERLPYPRELPDGGHHVRRDVRRAARSGGGGAPAGDPAGWPDRDGELDPGRVHRRDAADDRALRAPAGRDPVAAALGHRRRGARAARGGVRALTFARRIITFEYPLEPAAVVDYFRMWYGPTRRAFEALDSKGRDGLRPIWSGCGPSTTSRGTGAPGWSRSTWRR